MSKKIESMNFRVVLVGVDGPEPGKQILLNCQNAVETEILDELERDIKRDNIQLTVQSGDPTDIQKKKIGSDNVIHIQQYDMGFSVSIDKSLAFFERVIIGQLERMGFSVTGVISEEPNQLSIN
jgi:hypothetical protein